MTVNLSSSVPFWKTKSLEEMSATEWESLCDGCGRCCLNKLEDWDTGEIVWTDISCRLLDAKTCRCSNYAKRTDIIPDCIPLDPVKIEELTWLPPTCGYRIVADGGELQWWHPLISGDPETVHAAGISVRGKVQSESGFDVEDFPDHIVTWPEEFPIETAVGGKPDSGADMVPDATNK